MRTIIGVICMFLSAGPVGAQTDVWSTFVSEAEREHGDVGRRAAAFLQASHPDRDASIDPALLRDNLDLALRARREFPWARHVPEDVFFNDVLPYAVFDETRESWRPVMYEMAREIVADCSTASEAAQALNREIFNLVNVHYNTGRKKPNQNLSESMSQGRATCTGLSIILVQACRSVGVPARAAGVASWHDKRGNHTWVEVWDGEWYFTGADEYDANGLNRGWFTGDAAKAVPGDRQFAVWATSWDRTDESFPMVWARGDDSVPGVDVSGRYIPPDDVAVSDGVTRYVRTSMFGERVVSQVRVFDAAGALVAEFETRAGTADLNDMPSFSVPAHSDCTMEVDHGGMTFVGAVHNGDDASETYDIDLLEFDVALDEVSAARTIEDVWRIEVTRIIGEKADRPDDTFVIGDHEMQILEKVFGEAPEGGHSLWISMHGGGGAPARVNDQQWRNQIRLYEPEEGIYVAPRAPTNTWNLWHQAHIDPLFDQLIATYVATRNVHPDRVYLLGYSAGGDGVYQLAPRMADRFASASMMAGHPNESEPLGLRNLPFGLFMGGQDESFNRNTVAAAYGERLAALRADDPEGYEHFVKIYPDHGHWMEGEDAEALPWMAGHVRTPWPRRIVWDQDDVHQERFYWLGAPELATGGVIVATAEGQTISLNTDDVSRVDLYLSDELVDLDRPITVVVNSEVEFEGVVRRTRGAVTRSLQSRRDPRLAATAVLTVTWE